MTVVEKIETFLMEIDLSYREIEKNTWMISEEEEGIGNIIIRYEDPVILFRVKVLTVPSLNKEAFYKNILELNATDMLYGAYGIEGDNIVIINTLAAENLDFNEFQSTIESISMALIEHMEILKQFISKGDE